ncbi:hypothetical protein DIPPA_17781 [Diplonema papillatum]|nr:hypothetical protein DIPPA_17781 [Diplonema papillatum]
MNRKTTQEWIQDSRRAAQLLGGQPAAAAAVTRRPHRGPGNNTSTKQGFVLSNFRLGVIENEPELSACSAEASSPISWAKVLQVTNWGNL